MNQLRISAVSYLNTIPFVYGLTQSGLLKNYRLDLDVPSVCAEKLKMGMVDVALVPVGALPDFPDPVINPDFCIGAVGNVKTVLLLSRKPIEKIDTIHLDYDSRTSVQLIRVLSAKFWNIHTAWKNLEPGESENPGKIDSLVAIGDKTFRLVNDYEFVYDLAGEWVKFTGLPFVFAVWVSKEELPEIFREQLKKALNYGISHKAESVEYFKDKLPPCGDCLSYLENNISFIFDEEKKKGMRLFLSYL